MDKNIEKLKLFIMLYDKIGNKSQKKRIDVFIPIQPIIAAQNRKSLRTRNCCFHLLSKWTTGFTNRSTSSYKSS